MNTQLLQQGRVLDLMGKQGQERRGILIQVALVILLLAALSLFLFVFWGVRDRLPPSTYNPYAEGFQGIYRMFQELRLDTHRNRSSLGAFFSSQKNSKKDCLILLDPKLPQLTKVQEKALLSWIEKGGSLLATEPGFSTASLKGFALFKSKDPSPLSDLFSGLPNLLWAPLGGKLLGKGPLRDLQVLLPRKKGVEHKLSRYVIHSKSLTKGEVPILASTKDKGKDAWGIPTYGRPNQNWSILSEYRGHPVLLERRLGMGRVLFCSTPLFFSNFACGGMGTGKWAARTALLASRGRRRSIYFDEWSHGFALQKGFFHFLQSARLLYPLLGLLLLYLVLVWRGLVREGPISPGRELPRRSKEEYIFAQARLLDLSQKYDAAALWLFEGYDLLIQKETGNQDWPKREELRMRITKIKTGDRSSFQTFGRDLGKAFRSLVASKSRPSSPSEPKQANLPLAQR